METSGNPQPREGRTVREPSASWTGVGAPAALDAALGELADVFAYAEEERTPAPSDVGYANADRMLRAMYEVAPRRYAVYPGPDGEIAIDARDTGDGILVVACEADGQVACYVSGGGESRWLRYPSAQGLPDDFVRRGLAGLGADIEG